LKRRYAVALAVAVALSGCTNDYDQFQVAGEGGATGESGATGGSAGQAQGGSGGGTNGDASEEGGRAMPDGPADVTAEPDGEVAADGPADGPGADASAEVDAPFDGSPDVSRDAPPDVAPDFADAGDGGRPDVLEDGPTGDAIDGSVPEEPDVSVADAEDADVSIGVDADAADVAVEAPCGADTKLCAGTCVPLDDPAHGCASTSCSPCAVPPHATGAVCGISGACAIARCAAGFDDCDGVVGNGCETSLLVDVANCGQCGRGCSSAGVFFKHCVAGLCLPSCMLNAASCQSPVAPLPDDGCERFVATTTSCGGCDNNCAAQGVGQGLSCISTVCQCATNAVCGGVAGTCNPANRCVCGGATCQAGEACRTVGSGADGGTDASGDAEAQDTGAEDGDANAEDVDAEPEGSAPGTDLCSCNGGSACAAGQTCCQSPAGCIDLQTDPQNCGACGRSCAPGLICSGATCRCTTDATCNAGSSGTCLTAEGQCMCRTGGFCDPGRRCQADGNCG
jgi:hypothetical protein